MVHPPTPYWSVLPEPSHHYLNRIYKLLEIKKADEKSPMTNGSSAKILDDAFEASHHYLNRI